MILKMTFEVLFISTDIVAIIPDCSFPYTYNGGLYYRCIENIAEVSTAEQPLACINVNYTAVLCNSPGWRKIDNYRVWQKVTTRVLQISHKRLGLLTYNNVLQRFHLHFTPNKI